MVHSNNDGWFHEGEKPRVATFGGINSIFIVPPNKSIFNCAIEICVKIVNGVGNWWRESSVESLSVLAGERYHISYSELNVMDVNNRNNGSERTEVAPSAEPERRNAGSRAPSITIDKDIFGTDDG